MPNIVVLIKQVPDYESEKKLNSDFTLDRSEGGPLDEINERAVEEALQIKEAQGGEVTVLAVGPDKANDAVRKALSMGADKAIHVSDPAIAGSDAVQTAYILATAIGTVEGAELVIAGNTSGDGAIGAVPAIVADYLGLPALTHVRKLTVSGGTITAERETEEGVFTLESAAPAVVSVGEAINTPRFPSFKNIMAAKKKEIQKLTLADLGIDASVVGGAAAASAVTNATPKPPREAGQRVTDEGEGGNQIAQYLVSNKII
ncbi:MAG: electron transfer flavoprotein subunit beta/FixA family protein [Nocardiaceae bacterium]|nr:electron transfer flavoprotein subunit beta/FixA family protein [Nocardiaceae bacterium]